MKFFLSTIIYIFCFSVYCCIKINKNRYKYSKKFKTITFEEKIKIIFTKQYSADNQPNYLAVTKVNTNNNTYYYILTDNKNNIERPILAEAYYYDDIEENGWGRLSINTYSNEGEYTPFEQAYFAGYLEGRINNKRIYQFYINQYINNFKNNDIVYNQIKKYFQSAAEILKIKLITAYQNLQYFDRKLFLSFQQFLGLYYGYNSLINDNKKRITMGYLFIIQANAEISDLFKYFTDYDENLTINSTNYFKKAFNITEDKSDNIWPILLYKHSRCSAFIKIVKDIQSNKYTDLLAGHNTWGIYGELIRIVKHYNFQFDNISLKDSQNYDLIPSTEIIFTSYPGILFSSDDYMITNNNLLLTSTTIDIIDVTIFKSSDTYIPTFMRVLKAARFAYTAKDFLNIIKQNQGTVYASQWMVIDYKIFNDNIKDKTYEQIKSDNNIKDLFYLIEESPNKIIGYDITLDFINNTYFASFNRAFFQETKDNIHQSLIENLYGKRFSYEGSHRKIIFNHFQNYITNITYMDFILRYNGFNDNANKWKDDPSKNNPESGISSRFDLGTVGTKFGGTDRAFANNEMVNNMASIIIAGPTDGSNHQLPEFKWDNDNDNNNENSGHFGVPNKTKFPYLYISKNNIKNNKSTIFSNNFY